MKYENTREKEVFKMKYIKNFIIISFLLIIPVIGVSNSCYALESTNSQNITNTKRIIAHKGASKLAPENTLQAFRLAANANVFGVETDVRMTKDNILICNHDSTVDRTTNGTGLVRNLRYNSYIKNLKVDIGTQNKNKTYRIPTFNKYLDIIKKSNCYAIVELKQSDKKFIKKVLEKIRLKNMQNRTIIISFDYNSLKYIRSSLKSNIKLGYLTRSNSLNTINMASKLKKTMICPSHKVISQRYITYAHKKNIKINTWTVDSKTSKNRLFNLKVDYITSNIM